MSHHLSKTALAQLSRKGYLNCTDCRRPMEAHQIYIPVRARFCYDCWKRLTLLFLDAFPGDIDDSNRAYDPGY